MIEIVLAQTGADSPANVWLNENPIIVGLLALVLGTLLIASAVFTWKTGIAKNKLGQEFGGYTANISAFVRLILGALAIAYGIYNIFAG